MGNDASKDKGGLSRMHRFRPLRTPEGGRCMQNVMMFGPAACLRAEGVPANMKNNVFNVSSQALSISFLAATAQNELLHPSQLAS